MASNPDALVREWVDSVLNQGREDAIDRLMGPNAEVHGLSGPKGAPIRGAESFKPFFRMFRRALSELQIDVVRTVVQGDLVVAHCRVFGRHAGDSLGGPATNNVVEFWGMALVRVEHDRIVEGWNCFDFLSMYQQLGWVKNPPIPVA
jgi:predicted ester cyclase